MTRVPGALRSGAGAAIAAALLFGASTPLAKLLLDRVDAWLLAGLLYFGAGLGLSAVWGITRLRVPRGRAEAAIGGRQAAILGCAIVLGGVVGPVSLMFGLSVTTAAAASLLLNLEGAFTALLAWFVFKEGRDRRIVLGMALVFLGAVILSAGQGISRPGLVGTGLITLACLCWAADNNLTRLVSLHDPVQISALKGLCAGAVNLVLALGLRHGEWPSLAPALAGGVVGFLGYGVSLVLYVVALRHIGAGRTAAYFSLAPFMGVVIALALLGEPASPIYLVAAIPMALGLWLHVSERHEHEHVHERLVHTHLHVHDEHHRHGHGPRDPAGEPHTHEHVHQPLRHSHPHYPDLHHTHGHPKGGKGGPGGSGQED
ncbi:MAG: DMT family transporter [Alphaproteobacteria bacterium]